MNKKTIILSIIILVLDQIIKIIVSSTLSLNQSIKVINNFFYITYVNNTGAAWSILSDHTILLIILSLFAIIIIIKYMKSFKKNNKNFIAFGLLLGGILGNLLDRLFLGYVRDFLDFHLFGYNYPVFNISDMAMFFGVILLIIAVIKGEDNENISRR